MTLPLRVLLFAATLASTAFALDVRTEMQCADDFGKKAPSLLLRNELRPFWPTEGSRFAYRVNTAPGQHQFFQVDLATCVKSPAFDHEALANALGQVTKTHIDKNKLPIQQLEIAADAQSVRFRANGKSWRYTVADHRLDPDDLPVQSVPLLSPRAVRASRGGNGDPTELTFENMTDHEVEMMWLDPAGEPKSYGKIGAHQTSVQHTYAGHAWMIVDNQKKPLGGIVAPDHPVTAKITGKVSGPDRVDDKQSPDGKWRASTRGGNVFIEPASGGERIALSHDGSQSDGFNGEVFWSPDSRKLVAFREKEIKVRTIQIVQSSPPDQLQPKVKTIDYAKPGDPISQPMPHLFDIEGKREIAIDSALFNNPWEIMDLAWSGDSSEFSFVYNQRGHQVMRMAGVRGDTGSARTIFEDKSDTFIDYSQKYFIHRLAETGEILWASERDGWNHLYLLDSATGAVKSRVTQGNGMLREVVDVNEKERRLLLKVVGVEGQDPYYEHFVRVNFDGSAYTRLTTGDGTHHLEFSPDDQYYTDTWSRVDLPPVVELKRAADGKLLCELERADDSALLQTGWSRPERFVAKGRDGKTDIYGVIIRPVHFKADAKYPVVENIYAGPQDFFTPKAYAPWSGMNAMAELGFVLVQMDGMGTNWRGKAFHNVCWKNLKDAGFPDRIPWIKAAAATRPWMDLDRVGIYGGSAGGQNAMEALLDHGDFYKVSVADCGCHDNRMDKIWWNEAWMGWPVDESYERNSNVTRVASLRGKLLLMVGEMDTNVDPASTTQVVGALEKAGKDFEFLSIINSNHGSAETPYGKYRRAEFLVRNLTNR